MSHRIVRALCAPALVPVLTLTLLVVAAAPAAAVDKEHRQLAADLRVLQEQSQQLQILLNSLTEALKAVNTRLDQQAEANRKAFADQKLVVDNLSGDVRVIRERLDDNNVRVASLSQELEALRQAVQQMAAARPATDADPSGAANAPQNPPSSVAGQPGVAPAGGAAPFPIAPGTSPTKLYDAAYADYTAGQWDLAVIGFDSFIRTFPRSDMADNAQVNIGNAYLQSGQYDKAVEAYDIAIRTYPAGDAIPEAYFKKGLALQNLRDLAGTRDAWDFVIKTFPDSTAAIQAKQRLEQLRRP